MKLSTKESGNVTVLELEGSVLGGPDATLLNDTMHQLLERNRKQVVLDLSGVLTMNSSGLSMLINALQTMKKSGGTLKIAAASRKIESLLTITKLTTVFELHSTVKKALESFSR